MRTLILLHLFLGLLATSNSFLELRPSFSHLTFKASLASNPSSVLVTGSTMHILARKCIPHLTSSPRVLRIRPPRKRPFPTLLPRLPKAQLQFACTFAARRFGGPRIRSRRLGLEVRCGQRREEQRVVCGHTRSQVNYKVLLGRNVARRPMWITSTTLLRRKKSPSKVSSCPMS